MRTEYSYEIVKVDKLKHPVLTAGCLCVAEI